MEGSSHLEAENNGFNLFYWNSGGEGSSCEAVEESSVLSEERLRD